MTKRFVTQGRRHPRFGGPGVAQRWAITKTQAQHLQRVERAKGGTATYLAIRRGFVGTARFKECQWIAGDPSASDECKCRHPVEDGKPYCSDHAAIAYRKTED